MKIQEILSELEFNYGTFPRKAIEDAIANREKITPELLKIIEHAEQNVDELVYQESYMAHIYAMYLLAQFREKRAYPLIVSFFSIPGEISLDLTGDVVTEDLGRILASVSHGDISLMTSLVENEDANEYVRGAAMEGLLTLVACGQKSREEIMSYFQSLFQGKLARDRSLVWSLLVSCCANLYPEEVLQDIKRAYENGLVEEGYIDFEWVEESLARGKENALRNLREDRRHKFIEDTIREMEWWACFRLPEQQQAVRRKKEEFDIHQLDDIDSYDSGMEEACEEYQDALLERFFNSPEGQARLQEDPELGFWAAQLMYYGYSYIGVTVPQMTAGSVDEIVTELFPRKISISSPEDADDAIPELVAFWQYLKREYKLPKANSILRFLRKIEPDFKRIINDPSRFGMAKSFFTMGRAAGFDMTSQEDIDKFIQVYNAAALAPDLQPLLSETPSTEKDKGARKRRRRKRKRKR